MCGVGDGAGEAPGIGIPGMLCISGFTDGEALGVGVGDGIAFDPPAAAGGSDFGVGDGIGVPCLCCPCADAINTNPSNGVSIIRVSGRVKYSSLRLGSDINQF